MEVEKALMINSPFLSYTDEGRVYNIMMEVEKALMQTPLLYCTDERKV